GYHQRLREVRRAGGNPSIGSGHGCRKPGWTTCFSGGNSAATLRAPVVKGIGLHRMGFLQRYWRVPRLGHGLRCGNTQADRGLERYAERQRWRYLVGGLWIVRRFQWRHLRGNRKWHL